MCSLVVRYQLTSSLFSSKHCPKNIRWLQLMESSRYFCQWLDFLHTCTAPHQIKPALQEIRLSLCNLQMQLTSATLWPLANKSDCKAALITARHCAASLSSAGRQRLSFKYFALRLPLDILVCLNSWWSSHGYIILSLRRRHFYCKSWPVFSKTSTKINILSTETFKTAQFDFSVVLKLLGGDVQWSHSDTVVEGDYVCRLYFNHLCGW